MKKLMVLALMTTAVFAYRPLPVYIVNEGLQGPTGPQGPQGEAGVCECDREAFRSAMAAVSSVELNPDHQGFSIGVGGSSYGGTSAGAIGIMYGVGSWGINVKGYDAEGGYNGASVGVTYGF